MHQERLFCPLLLLEQMIKEEINFTEEYTVS